MARLSRIIVAFLLAMGCAHQPRKYVVEPRPDGAATLPQDEQALLALSDKTAALGPGGPDLTRSLAAANQVLACKPRHGEAAWRAARALYLQTYTAKSGQGELAARCIDVSAVATAYSRQAEAYYYAALCMGARVRARQLEGLDLVPRMEKAGQAALAADPKIAQAGPHRLLGGIYLWAPAWPASIGDLDLAIEHLQAAVTLAPDWAENHMLLGFALLEDEQFDAAEAALAESKKRLGAPEAAGWRPYWEERIAELEQLIAKRRD